MNFKTHVLRLLVFLIMLFSVDRGLGIVFDKLMENSKNEDLVHLENILRNVSADVIVIGDSRAKYHYIPSEIVKATGLTCYNMGRRHTNLFYHQFLIENYLLTRKTKAIILDILPTELYKESFNADGFTDLRPFYGVYNSTIDSCLSTKFNYEKLKNISRIYRYNSMFNVFVSDIMRRDIIQESNLGFLPRKGVLKEQKFDDWRKAIGKTTSDIDLTKLLVLQHIVDKCKANKVQLFLISSPLHAKIPNDSPCIKVFNQFVEENNIHYLNMSENSDYIHDNLMFSDYEHMNESGALSFSKDVGIYINKLKGSI